MELVIKAGRNQSIPLVDRIRDVIDGDRKVKPELIELKDFDYDTVKVARARSGG